LEFLIGEINEGCEDKERCQNNFPISGQLFWRYPSYLLKRIVGLFNEKDRMDGSKRMASKWEVILMQFLSLPKANNSN